jgi:hypothetical protein
MQTCSANPFIPCLSRNAPRKMADLSRNHEPGRSQAWRGVARPGKVRLGKARLFVSVAL